MEYYGLLKYNENSKYFDKISDYDLEQLQKEQAKIKKSLTADYIDVQKEQVSDYFEYQFFRKRENIAENEEEKQRLLLRTQLALPFKYVSGQLQYCPGFYSENWQKINEAFCRSDGSLRANFFDEHLTIIARIKNLGTTYKGLSDISFLNLLTVDGLKLYKDYLENIYTNLSNGDSLDSAIRDARLVQSHGDGYGIFTNKILFSNWKTATKKIIRLGIVENKIKQLKSIM